MGVGEDVGHSLYWPNGNAAVEFFHDLGAGELRGPGANLRFHPVDVLQSSGVTDAAFVLHEIGAIHGGAQQVPMAGLSHRDGYASVPGGEQVERVQRHGALQARRIGFSCKAVLSNRAFLEGQHGVVHCDV